MLFALFSFMNWNNYSQAMPVDPNGNEYFFPPKIASGCINKTLGEVTT